MPVALCAAITFLKLGWRAQSMQMLTFVNSSIATLPNRYFIA